MKKAVPPKEALAILSSIQSKSLVLIGGCFDLLHDGHLAFISEAKKYGDFLIVLLESDQAIKDKKGINRPIQHQKKRASVLLKKSITDLCILLPYPFINQDYDNLVTAIKPAIIATTKGDPYLFHKKRQAAIATAKVVEVIERISNYSTSSKVEHE